MNPLFPDSQDPQQPGYVLPHSQGRGLTPLTGNDHADPAIELIRGKIDALFAKEPSARAELAEAEAEPHRSKHQQFMHHLSTSGKSLAEIQTAWHQYYQQLPTEEKRAIWQEFYKANGRSQTTHTLQQHQHAAQQTIAAATPHPTVQHHVVVADHSRSLPVLPHRDRRSVSIIKKQVLHKVRMSEHAQQKAKQHFQSLLFGLGLGTVVLLIFLFSFFNQIIITPFIQPGHASATPIILSTDGVAPSATPEVIIPKINVQLPAIYGASASENDIQNNLLDGVAHYPTTSLPGQLGNTAFFGHSSNNIFNPGKYKFAFVLLHTLAPGDIFYLTNAGKLYTYKVYQIKIVQPNETWVLSPVAGKAATATLITCDPPGTSLHRLVVWGEQINPDPNVNVAAPAPVVAAPTQLTGNGASLWSRMWDAITFW